MPQETQVPWGSQRKLCPESLLVLNIKDELMFMRQINGGWSLPGRTTCAKTSGKGQIVELVIKLNIQPG